MTVCQGAEAWSLFWEEKRVGGTCLVSSGLLGELQNEWFEFARSLPRGARIIDLGCGAGNVGLALMDCRRDVTVVGVDSARVPSNDEQGLTLLSSVRMEVLPFEANSFDAAVSQFGIEYGNILDTAPELARVLNPGAAICFLAHHHDSKIARDGRMRHAALRALDSETTHQAFLSGDVARLRAQFQQLSRRYPDEWSIGPAQAYFERHIGGTGTEREKAVENFADLIAPDISLLSHSNKAAFHPVASVTGSCRFSPEYLKSACPSSGRPRGSRSCGRFAAAGIAVRAERSRGKSTGFCVDAEFTRLRLIPVKAQ